MAKINTKDLKCISEFKDEIFVLYQFYIFRINFHNDCASGYFVYNQIVCPK